jgi:hypothetical protein
VDSDDRAQPGLLVLGENDTFMGIESGVVEHLARNLCGARALRGA